jgi:predicted metal-dependent enzyme (double-stranded beta helix superfamily)
MNESAKDPAFEHYIAAINNLWQPDSVKDPDTAHRVRKLMAEWLHATTPDANWVRTLKAEKPSGVPIHTSPDHGFIQMSHFHAGHRINTPHDHGPYWVVYGVYEGEVEIPVYVYDAATNTVKVDRIDRLKGGDAVAYLPGEIHSTRVPTSEPALVLRFLSTDLSQVPRQRFKPEQIVA